jgi:hypothetical protein
MNRDFPNTKQGCNQLSRDVQHGGYAIKGQRTYYLQLNFTGPITVAKRVIDNMTE